MDVAIYARVSTKKQDTENQLPVLREFAAKQVSASHYPITGTGKIQRQQGATVPKAGGRRRMPFERMGGPDDPYPPRLSEQELNDWRRHTDWKIAHRRMLVKEAANRDLNMGIDWTLVVIEVVICVVLALAWLR